MAINRGGDANEPRTKINGNTTFFDVLIRRYIATAPAPTPFQKVLNVSIGIMGRPVYINTITDERIIDIVSSFDGGDTTCDKTRIISQLEEIKGYNASFSDFDLLLANLGRVREGMYVPGVMAYVKILMFTLKILYDDTHDKTCLIVFDALEDLYKSLAQSVINYEACNTLIEELQYERFYKVSNSFPHKDCESEGCDR